MLNLIGTYIAQGTLAFHLSTNTVGHTDGISNIGSGTEELANWHYVVNSGTNLANLTNDDWSAHFWLAGTHGLSATCIGYSNGLAGQGLFSMVSPRHYLFAAHMHPEGQLAAFLDTNNIVYWRRTLQRTNISNDTAVGILNEDLPPSVGCLPLLPANFTNYLPTISAVQGIGMNQDLRLFGEPMVLGNPFVTWHSQNIALFGLGVDWNTTIRGGDSSNPALLLISNQLVLVSHNYFVNGGPNYAWQLDAINRGMHELSTHNGVGSDYQLTVFSLTNWPAINQ